MCIENILCLKLPIGWNELGVIATFCGAFATFCTVLVALWANRKATKQLKSALEMQEQSKNVGLLDKRIELAESIQSEKSVSELTLQVLFDDEIFRHYKAWKNHLSEKACAEHAIDIFFELSKTSDSEGGYTNDVQRTIHRFESAMSRSNCLQQIIYEYRAFCAENVVWQKTGEDEKMTPYNHAEISDRIAKADSSAKEEKALTLQLIEEFIAVSIQQINAKKKKEKNRPEREKRCAIIPCDEFSCP